MSSRLIRSLLATVMVTSLIITPITVGATESSSEPVNPWAGSVSSFEVASSESDTSKNVGVFITNDIDSIRIDGNVEQINQDIGVKSNEKLFPVGYEIDKTGSPLAFNCINATAEALGGDCIASINLNSAKMSDGELIPLEKDTVIPFTLRVKNPEAKKLIPIKVESNGVVTTLEDMDDDPNTVTIYVSGGLAAYAIIAI